jgi:hypothetical protein
MKNALPKRSSKAATLHLATSILTRAAAALALASMAVNSGAAPPKGMIADRLWAPSRHTNNETDLGTAMPRSFDVYPSDPCWGMWSAKRDSSEVFSAAVVRVAGRPFVHIDGMNFRPQILGPHAIRVRRGVNSITMHCSLDLALVDIVFTDKGETRHMALEATR